MEGMKHCDSYCPSLESFEAVQAQNWGCLPSQGEITLMLSKGQVWMCHSNLNKPCVATGLKEVPEGFEPRTEY